ncbi:MAG: hypothetical protein NC120_05120 [Ruminococcus sp.]|nr:hypothetical protein [Ruminococcus sp.]
MLKADTPKIIAGLQPYGDVDCNICSVEMWEAVIKALQYNIADKMLHITAALIKEMPCKMLLKSSCKAFLLNYVKAVNNYCENNIDMYMQPECCEFDFEKNEADEKLLMPVFTYEEHTVAEYTGLSFKEISQLDIFTYRLYLADALKVNILKRADGTGKEYLNKCYRYMHQIDDDIGC